MTALVYSDVAKAEIKEAAFWYEERSNALGRDFEKEVFEKIEFLKTYPGRYAVVKQNFREVKIKRFPFKIIYKFYKTRKIILITSVFHTSRNPKHKYKR